MKTLRFGEMTVQHCVESEGPSFYPGFIFPDSNPDAFEAERQDWLDPHFVDAESGRLLMSPQSAKTRQDIVERCADTDTVVLAAHFADPVAARVVTNGERWKLDLEVD